MREGLNAEASLLVCPGRKRATLKPKQTTTSKNYGSSPPRLSYALQLLAPVSWGLPFC